MISALSTRSLQRRSGLTALLVKKYDAETSTAAEVFQKITRLRQFREQEYTGLLSSQNDLQQELSRHSLKPAIDSMHYQAYWDLIADISRQIQTVEQQLTDITLQQDQQRAILEKLSARSRFYRDYHEKLYQVLGQRQVKQELVQLLDLYLLKPVGNLR